MAATKNDLELLCLKGGSLVAHPGGLRIACLLTAEASHSMLQQRLLQLDVERLWIAGRAGLLHHYQRSNRIRRSIDNLYRLLRAGLIRLLRWLLSR